MQNNELKNLKSRLEAIKKNNGQFIIKLIDKTYLVKNQELNEIDIIPENLKVYEVNTTDRNFFYYWTDKDNRPSYVIVKTVTECILDGELEDNRDWLDRNN